MFLQQSQSSYKPTLYNFFTSIGHSQLESSLQKLLEQIQNSFTNTYSKILRLIYFYSSESIVGSQFLKEIEADGYIHDLIELLQIWGKRTEDLNQNFSESFIKSFLEISTKNAPILRSFNFLSKDKYDYINQKCQVQKSVTTNALLQDFIAIMNDDLLQNRAIPDYWKSILALDDIIQDIRHDSKNYFQYKSNKGVLMVEGEHASDSQHKTILNGYGVIYKNALISKQGTFVQGLLDGKNCVEYSEEGYISSWGVYSKGLKNGFGIEFYPTQNILTQGFYQNGIMNGDDCEEYHYFGNLKFKGSMKDNTYHGKGVLYYKNGQLKYSGNFVNGLMEGDDCKVYNKYDGSLHYTGQMVKGIYNGYGTLYQHNIQEPVMKGIFCNGILKTGSIQTFYKNGNVEYIGGVNMGRYEGRGKLFHPTKHHVYHGNFKEGRENERETLIYDDSGNISLICGMHDGEPTGYMEAYDGNNRCYYSGPYNLMARDSVMREVKLDATMIDPINQPQNSTCNKGNCSLF